jgi:hypothetical protein
LFETSTIEWRQGDTDLGLTMTTAYPFAPDVAIRVTAARPKRFRVRVRIPGWAARAVALRVNGRTVGAGKPGSFHAIEREWQGGDIIAFTLPLEPRLTRYTGVDQLAGRARYGIEYGPLLLALTGGVTEKGDATLDLFAADLKARLRPIAGRPACFSIEGVTGAEFVPYMTINDEPFSCLPGLLA